MKVPEPTSPILAWCPTCREHVTPMNNGRCGWCETQTGGGEPPPEPARSSGKRSLRQGDPGWGPVCPNCGGRKGKQALQCMTCWLAAGRPRNGGPGVPRPDMRIPTKIRLDDLDECRRLYATGKSLNEVAAIILPRTEYANVHAAASSLFSLFKTRGWKLRPQGAVTAARNHRHGRKTGVRKMKRAARNQREQEYRRALRDERGWHTLQGPGRPQCEGVKSTHPRKGERCTRPAQEGSRFCWSHTEDPNVRAQQLLDLEGGRELAAFRRGVPLPMAPFALWLRSQVSRHGSGRATARAFGVSDTTISTLARGLGSDKKPKATVTRATVERFATAAGTTVEAIYQLGEPVEPASGRRRKSPQLARLPRQQIEPVGPVTREAAA